MIDPIQAAQIYRLLEANYAMVEGKMLFDGKQAIVFVRDLQEDYSDAGKIADLMQLALWDDTDCADLYVGEWAEDFVASLAGIDPKKPRPLDSLRLAFQVLDGNPLEDLQVEARELIRKLCAKTKTHRTPKSLALIDKEIRD